MRIGNRQLISPPGTRSTSGGARSMPYQQGVVQRLQSNAKNFHKKTELRKLKIALLIFVLIPCLSSISQINNANQPYTPQTRDEYRQPEVVSEVSVSPNTDTPTDDLWAAVIPNLLFTPEPKPTHEQPEANEDVPLIMVYEVVSGDTLEGIARRHNTITSYLLQINDIDNPASLSIGQLVNVPTPEAGAPTPRPMPTQDPTIATAADIEALAQMVHAEAHWESHNGKVGVAQCAYDRWRNTRRVQGQPYVWNPDGEMTLTEIVTAAGQFAVAEMNPVCESCHQAARDVVSGTRAFRDYIVTNFRVHESVDDWNSLPYLGHIGGHAFYGYIR